MQTRLLVLLVEKVDLLVMVQTMVVVLKVLVVAAELKRQWREARKARAHAWLQAGDG